MNPDLQNGSQDWSQYGGAKVDFTEFEGNKVVIVRGRGLFEKGTSVHFLWYI